MTFDSKAEQKANAIFEAIGAHRYDSKFDPVFHDCEGTPFRAKSDFWHSQSGTYIEYKPCKLNKKRSKRTADNDHANRVARGARNAHVAASWSNSVNKQAIVQSTLGHYNFVVCFDKSPSPEEAEYYAKKGVIWCTLASLRNYLAFTHFRKRGLSIGFRHHAHTYVQHVR